MWKSNMKIYLHIILLFNLNYLIKCQRPSSAHRSDVYIAGFFPYGDKVENSDTGLKSNPSIQPTIN